MNTVFKTLLAASIGVAAVFGDTNEIEAPQVSGSIYTNFHWDIENDNTDFAITAAHLAVLKKLSPSTEANIEIESAPRATKSTVYLLKAYVAHMIDFGVSVDAGLISTFGYSDIMDFYGYSYYIYPVLVEELGQPRTDLGVAFRYDIHESSTLKFGVFSGRGFDSLSMKSQGDDLVYGLEYAHTLGVISMNCYADIAPHNGTETLEPEATASITAALDVKKFRGGIEYVYRMNDSGSDADSAQVQGMAFFGLIPVTPIEEYADIELFARFDMKMVKDDTLGMIRISAGIQYAIEENMYVALKYDTKSYDAKNRDAEQSLGLYTSFQF